VRRFLGDCREVVEKEEIKGVDRIIMNLPKTADNFLDVAFGICKKGTTVHFYYFLKEEELFWKGEEIIKENAGKFNRRVKFLEERKCGELAPHVYRVVIDFQIL
ncbi:MAG TPA: tRNA (guanine-N1)-methyltransferase, partial [Candidatus Aenigmarchaeota archaeon]|nr:tRNA (guanine-N1)-methyltransferase [Candidatus Aenigmarchaeota archaeon]